MGKVIKISITKESKGVMESLKSVTAIEGKGIVKDRHFKDNNDKKCQITLIEIESIRYS